MAQALKAARKVHPIRLSCRIVGRDRRRYREYETESLSKRVWVL